MSGVGDAGSGTPAGDGARRAELAGSLAVVRGRIIAAERAAGRTPGGVALVVVTKTFPASDVRHLAHLGVTDVGESREPEASAKAAACAPEPLRWHQVGQVQTGRAAAVATWADVVHSLDRSRLVTALSRAAVRADRDLQVFVQVSLDGDPARAGAQAADLPALADAVEAAARLHLLGLMAVAPAGVDPRGPMQRLAELAQRVRRDHPGATSLSAGMSGDLEAAVAAGATHVRIGRAVLGSRPPLR